MKTKTIALLVLSALTMSVQSNAIEFKRSSNPRHDDEVIADIQAGRGFGNRDFKNHDYLVTCNVSVGKFKLKNFAWTGKNGGHVHERASFWGEVTTTLNTTGGVWVIDVTDQDGKTFSKEVPKLAEGEKREIRLDNQVCVVVEHVKPWHDIPFIP